MAELDYAPPKKRSVLIAGHPTSISLEPIFWRALEAEAKGRGCALNALVAMIDAARLNCAEPPNLTSAIRQWLFGEIFRSSEDSPGECAPLVGRMLEE